VSDFIVARATDGVNADYVITVNSLITRSGALDPGQLRSDVDRIGVDTRYGRHEPAPVSHAELDELVKEATSRADDLIGRAAALFVHVAAAQPFMDGNKRTALFAAEGYLLHADSGQLLSLPTRDIPGGPEAMAAFNDLLARAYLYGEVESVITFLWDYTMPIPAGTSEGCFPGQATDVSHHSGRIDAAAQRHSLFPTTASSLKR
jgi:hypothetical protein